MPHIRNRLQRRGISGSSRMLLCCSAKLRTSYTFNTILKNRNNISSRRKATPYDRHQSNPEIWGVQNHWKPARRLFLVTKHWTIELSFYIIKLVKRPSLRVLGGGGGIWEIYRYLCIAGLWGPMRHLGARGQVKCIARLHTNVGQTSVNFL